VRAECLPDLHEASDKKPTNMIDVETAMGDDPIDPRTAAFSLTIKGVQKSHFG